ncbi:oligomeric Golgi complex subunit 7 [Mycena floridula]|nr:oligomeric Golgi complex subunit 7 [Mycena floridula]
MVLPAAEVILDSLEEYSDIVSWINDTLSPPDDSESSLSELDQHITQLIATLDIACEDTSSKLEHIIDDVSRGVPRLTYDLHFMKDGAISLQNSLANVQEHASSAIPAATNAALEQLRVLDSMKTHMEAAREVLREAESWSTLELEVTSLLSEKSYAKAAARLSEASRSMVVFQNTPEYDPRRALMVNLQNQLEASLSSALVAAINAQNLKECRDYFSIFSNIQRESEFRSYYYGSRRTALVAMWQQTRLSDCDPGSDSTQTFVDFLPKFYSEFLSLLNLEKTFIPAIFPDPAPTLSGLITSVLSSLQPTFSQRLSSLLNNYGDSSLKELIHVFRSTEEFAVAAQKVMEKIKYSTNFAAPSTEEIDSEPAQKPSHNRRRSMRMSMSFRSGMQKTSTGGLGGGKSASLDGIDWDQEVFQPFLDFQIDYGSLERRLLESSLREIISSESENVPDQDQARLLRERAIDIFGAGEDSVSRCVTFTYGFAAVGLVQALDGFIKSFIDLWTADVRMVLSSASGDQNPASEDDLSGLDYTSQDWSQFQQSIHLLASARSIYERMSLFEAKLVSNLSQVASKFRMAQGDPINFSIAPLRGEAQLLEQSTLYSAELHALLERVDSDLVNSRDSLPPTPLLRHSHSQPQVNQSDPVLVEARGAIFSFAKACQTSLQTTILSPLRNHLTLYSSSTLWTTPGDPKAKHTVTSSDLQVPSFSISPSDIVQRIAEGLLNLPRLFEVYADDDALSFSMHTLPYVDAETLKALSEQLPAETSHSRRPSMSTKSATIDHELVSSAWLSSLGHSLLAHLTSQVLPSISVLTPAGAAQLASDLGYLSNIVRALNVESEDLETWREYVDVDKENATKRAADSVDTIFQHVARMRGWVK